MQSNPSPVRKTSQHLLPEKKPGSKEGTYDIYPTFTIDHDVIKTGFESLADALSGSAVIIIDGFGGVFYELFCKSLESSFTRKGKSTHIIFTSSLMKSPGEIEEIISPFMGGEDPLFGTRATLSLYDFFDIKKLENAVPDPRSEINIIAGPGAAFARWKGPLVYIDLPKNEIQFRSRACSITNLGAECAGDPKEMYKRFYFVDWPVLNKHKQCFIGSAEIIVDGQHPENPSWMPGSDLLRAIDELSRSAFRARPWFEPGVWGGNWIKKNIPGLNRDVPNYAWSFELISPENGLLFESSGRLLEVSFDTLMLLKGEAVLGNDYSRFGREFPIRFDFLDTFDGGNLSIQCHPRPEYTKEHFGEEITQEEAYYILDAGEDAAVFLGFQDDIDSGKFKKVLRESFNGSKPADIESFVMKHPSKKHDLFLIPYGTIHGSGKNNLVLEISTTPYIFTFKLYDWLRPDLDGKPRPLNIERGMENLYFDRKGDYVSEKLISKPVLLNKDEGWELWHLPTHETHIYDVHRLRISSSADVETGNKCHVLNLVEGKSITVIAGGRMLNVNYAETFIVPAAAGSYRILNNSHDPAMVVLAFVK